MSGRFRITSCAMAWTRHGDWLGWIRRIFNFGTYTPKAGTDKDEELGLNAARDLLGHKNSSMTVQYVRHRKGKLVQPTKLDWGDLLT